MFLPLVCLCGGKFVQFLRMEIWRPKHVEAAMMRYRTVMCAGWQSELEDIAHPAPLIAYAIAEAHRGGSKGEAGELLREEAARARSIFCGIWARISGCLSLLRHRPLCSGCWVRCLA